MMACVKAANNLRFVHNALRWGWANILHEDRCVMMRAEGMRGGGGFLDRGIGKLMANGHPPPLSMACFALRGQ